MNLLTQKVLTVLIPCPKPKKGKRKVQGVPQSQTTALPRPQLLNLAHATPMPGHLDIHKAYHKIRNRFYWQGKSGHEYLLTIMCASILFPEAIPLGNIKTKNIVKALVNFFTFVGPQSVQWIRSQILYPEFSTAHAGVRHYSV